MPFYISTATAYLTPEKENHVIFSASQEFTIISGPCNESGLADFKVTQKSGNFALFKVETSSEKDELTNLPVDSDGSFYSTEGDHTLYIIHCLHNPWMAFQCFQDERKLSKMSPTYYSFGNNTRYLYVIPVEEENTENNNDDGRKNKKTYKFRIQSANVIHLIFRIESNNHQFRYDVNSTIFEVPKSVLDEEDEAGIRIFILEDTMDALKKKVLYSEVQLKVKDQAVKIANDQIDILQMDLKKLGMKVSDLKFEWESEKASLQSAMEEKDHLVMELEAQRQELTEKLQMQMFNAQALLEEKVATFTQELQKLKHERDVLKLAVKARDETHQKQQSIIEILQCDPSTQVTLKCSDGIKVVANRTLLSHHSSILKELIEKSYGSKVYYALSCGASIKSALMGSDSILIPDFNSTTIKGAYAWMMGQSENTDGLLDFSHRYHCTELKKACLSSMLKIVFTEDSEA